MHRCMITSRNPVLRTTYLVTGVVVVILSPVVGAIPGPGGVFVFAAGLALVLQNSHKARRGFVQIKRRYPRVGHYADMGLRRQSFARRRARDRIADDAPAPSLRSRIASLFQPR